jgi:hypothetical protein
MRALIGALAVGLPLTLVACGGGTTPAANGSPSMHSSCAGVPGKHHAYVVVEHASGKVVKACVGFSEAQLSGVSLFNDAHIEFQTQATQYGPAVCQIDNEPAHYDKCLPADAPYWANWLWTGSSWQMAQTGYSDMKFSDHQALGWVYTPQTGSPAPPPPPPTS